MRVNVFAEPLVPVGTTTPQDNHDLAQALTAFLQRTQSDDCGAITQFLDTHPQSAWRVSLLTDLGLAYRRTGWFSKALSCWTEAWTLANTATDPKAKAVADRAVAELFELDARLGRYNRLEELFSEIKGRVMSSATSEKIEGAREGLWLMQNRPQDAFRCGPMALNQIRAFQHPGIGTDKLILDSRSTAKGMSLFSVCELANQLGMNYQMAKRQPGAEVIMSAVVNWKVGHYAALIKEENGRYLVQDPTFGDEMWISQAALDAEASGYFLVRTGDLPKGWSPVSAEEGKTVWGKGDTGTSSPNNSKPCDCKDPPCKSCNKNQTTPPTTPPMAQYAFHSMLVSLNIMDTPVGYSPPRGPDMHFQVTYNQREANQPTTFTYSNLGPKWTFNWLSYISDNPTQLGGDVNYYVQGGGTEFYPGSSYNSSTKTYAADPDTDATLQIISATNYTRILPDGSTQIFSVPNAPTNAVSRKVFLSQIVDPAGNAVTLNYDSNFRLSSVVDSLGQVTTLSYASTNISDPLFYQIAKVTDPFSRFATFDYNTNDELVKITDILGITSQFTYGLSDSGTMDFITSLTTPYGATIFTEGANGRTRWLTATDPLGGQERLEYDDVLSTGDFTDLNQPAPTNIVSPDSYLYARNSFFWDKKAMQLYPGDYTKARIHHWLHSSNINICSGTQGSSKSALEGRIWYTYPGQNGGDLQEGTNNSPSAISRVLDDGTTQITKYQRNPIGKPTIFTDPSGRITLYTYATNNIDLLSVAQLDAGATNILAQYTYNFIHTPMTVVDAAGQTNFYGYNTNGQLVAMTNALNEITLLNYDTNGNLTNIIAGTTQLLSTNSFAYDGYGRVRTVTDSQSSTFTTSYDAADRPTNITYMDGTYEQIVYNYLDPVLQRDRDGHWTSMIYDPLRHLTDTFNNAGQHIHFDWCNCGSLSDIIDPDGNATSWIRDLQNRVMTKTFPDQTQINYTYETNISRLKMVTDAKNQSTIYSYFIDDNLKQVTYSNAVMATPSVSFTYDTNYNRNLTMTDGTGTTTYDYYPVASGQLGAGRLLSVSNSFIGASSVISYNYDALGRITNRAINGVAQQVAFDMLNRVGVITNVLGSFTNTYVGGTMLISTNFAPFGKKTIFSYLGITNDERLSEIWNQTTNSVTLSKFDYIYDAVGNITNWTEQADTNTPTVAVMQYDPINQLLNSTTFSNTVAGAVLKQYAYSYDLSGNRTSEQIVTTTNTPVAVSLSLYDSDNQVTNRISNTGSLMFAGSISRQGTVMVNGIAATMNLFTTNFVGYASVTNGTNVVPVVATDYGNHSQTNRYQLVVTNNGVSETISYDLNGNLTNVVTANSTNSYQFDAANRLVSITSPTNQSLFTYDGLGKRVQIVELTNGVPFVTNKFLWEGAQLCEQRDCTGGNVTKRFFVEGEQISGTNYFFTRDHLGSVREMTDSTGGIRARYDYDPYGQRTKLSGDIDADFSFSGYYYHSSSGLYLTLYRAYSVDLRWLSRDPLADEGMNLYAYTLDNPINGIDPFGGSFWSTLDTIVYIIPILGTLRNLIPPSGVWQANYQVHLNQGLCKSDPEEAERECKNDISSQELNYIANYWYMIVPHDVIDGFAGLFPGAEVLWIDAAVDTFFSLAWTAVIDHATTKAQQKCKCPCPTK